MRVSGVQPNYYGQRQVAFAGDKEKKLLVEVLTTYPETRLTYTARKKWFKGLTETEYLSDDVQKAFNERDIKEQEICPNNVIEMMKKHIEKYLIKK